MLQHVGMAVVGAPGDQAPKIATDVTLQHYADYKQQNSQKYDMVLPYGSPPCYLSTTAPPIVKLVGRVRGSV